MNIKFNEYSIAVNGNLINNSFDLIKLIRNNKDVFNNKQNIKIISAYLLLFIIREIKSDNRINYLINKVLDSYYPITDDDNINKTIDDIIDNLLSNNFMTRTEFEEYLIKYLTYLNKTS